MDAYLVSVGETHLFSPSIFNNFHIGYTHTQSNELTPATQPLFSQFGFKGIPLLQGLAGLPMVTFTGFASLGDRNWAPNLKLVQETQLNDVVSWVKGDHTITFGGEAIDTHNLADSWNMPRGLFHFAGQFTSQIPGKGHGSAFADLLLGQTARAGLGTVQLERMRNHYYGLFINDSWKTTPKLTVDLGLRYDLQTPWWERDNRMSNFDFDSSNSSYGSLVSARAGSYLARTFAYLDTNNFAPRVGIAYQLTPKTVIRSGFGIFYGNWGYMGNNDSGGANPPYLINITVNSATNANLSSLKLADGFPPGLLIPSNAKNPNLYSLSPNYPMPAVDQWNFAVQRELPAESTVTVAYVGSSTSHLAGLNDINAPPPGPGAINPRRPFPVYGEIENATPYAHATYHALQLTYERRFSNGLSILSDYTWSHSLDNVLNHEDNVGGAFPQDPNDTAAEKAPSGYDIPNRFVTSIVYQLPVGRAGSLLGKTALGRAVFGGWELGGIFVAQAGYPLTPVVSPDPANTTTPARPDRLCDGNLPSGQRSIDHWYNPGCFAPAAPFTYGNSARDVIRAPGLVNLDSLVDRTFRFTESKSLEFRAEFFNFANTAHFGAPDMTVNQPQAGSITSDASANREIQFGLRFVF